MSAIYALTLCPYNAATQPASQPATGSALYTPYTWKIHFSSDLCPRLCGFNPPPPPTLLSALSHHLPFGSPPPFPPLSLYQSTFLPGYPFIPFNAQPEYAFEKGNKHVPSRRNATHRRRDSGTTDAAL